MDQGPRQNLESIHLLYMTAPDLETAENLASYAVESRLAACANIFKDMQSVYRWQGKIEKETEVVVLFKTPKCQLENLRRALNEKHPYECPCLIDWSLNGANLPYWQWLIEQTHR